MPRPVPEPAFTTVASARPETPRPAGRPAPRILVVEDQIQLLRALEINLRARQYEVLTLSLIHI